MYQIPPFMKDISVDLFPAVEWLENLKVEQIKVCHQGIDSSKWSRGLDINEWIYNETQETEEQSEVLEKEIMKKINEEPIDFWLKQEIFLAWVYYYGYVETPQNHRYHYVPSVFEVSSTKSPANSPTKYTVQIRLFPFLLSRQQNYPIWHKGSIQISWVEDDREFRRWQVIKWSGYKEKKMQKA